ncbi:MAG: OmpA family protein [Epsilonproteobacteria bacterium]|nr:OmpA family protein [Campylobacterota bacterium]
MSRRGWMWLWVIILVLFFIICLWSKQDELSKQQASNIHANKMIKHKNGKTITNTAKIISGKKPVKRKNDITFKIVKDENGITLYGVFPTNKDIKKVSDGIKSSIKLPIKLSVSLDYATDNPKMVDAIVKLCQNLSSYKEGVVEYKHGVLKINGKAYDKKDEKTLLQTAVNSDKDIQVISDTKIVERVVETNTTQNLLSDTNSTTKSLSDKNETQTITQEKKAKIEKEKQSAYQEINGILKNTRIKFLRASDTLTQESRMILNQISKILKKYSHIKIQIEGHTDSEGLESRNQRLSERRALAVKNYLVKHGIKSDRLSTIGYGESKPLVKNDTKSHRAINRRVEFKVLQ